VKDPAQHHIFFMGDPLVTSSRKRTAARDENELLPDSFEPGNKDVICGRARENFHHEGNKYFRELIQKNIGPYIGSRTKLEKGDAIARIAQVVRENSPSGGFVRKDERTGKWFRIKESEARDKVGHAIRKAVQRLEDTKPKLAARLKREYSATTAKASKASVCLPETKADASVKKPAAISETEDSAKSVAATSDTSKETSDEATLKPPPEPRLSTGLSTGSETSAIRTTGAERTQSQLPSLADQLSAFRTLKSGSQQLASAPQNEGETKSAVEALKAAFALPSGNSPPLLAERAASALTGLSSLDQASAFYPAYHSTARGLSINPADLLSQSLSRAHNSSANPPASLLSSYDQLLALRAHEQKSQKQLAMIRALQQQEEAKLRRDIEYTSQRFLPFTNSLDPMVNLFPWRRMAPSLSSASGLGSFQPPPLSNIASAMTAAQQPNLLLNKALKKEKGNQGETEKKNW